MADFNERVYNVFLTEEELILMDCFLASTIKDLKSFLNSFPDVDPDAISEALYGEIQNRSWTLNRCRRMKSCTESVIRQFNLRQE